MLTARARPSRASRAKALTMISLELGVDDVLGPVVAVEVLDPLEVADGDAAGVAQDVGDQEDAALVEDRRRPRASSGRWRPRRRCLALIVVGVLGRDLVLEGGRDEDVALDLEELRVGDVARRRGSPATVPCSFFQAMTALDVEPVGVVDAAGRVGHGDDRASPRRAISCAAIDAGVAEALDGDRAPSCRSMPRCVGRLDDAVDGAAGGRLVAALRAAEADRLAGDDARDGVPDVHRVRVHDPGHRSGRSC